MSSILYNLIVRPLYLFFEFVFVKAYMLIGNYGYTIIVLSLTINFLVLPLYRRADAMQAEERDKEKAMSRWISHIKKTFKGDERYMMLNTYYRQNNFRPTDSLKGTVSLLLQIPFFIAAYRFLSGVEQLRGVSFGLIRDLGAPDAMLTIMGLTINVLPILMTCINFVSGAIYTRGMPIKNKIQLYSMALVFLVLLYRSPAGLVFYWTLNNLFSLVKNIFYKLKNPGRVFAVLCAVCSPLLLFLFFYVHPAQTAMRKLFIIFLCVVLLIPLILELSGRTGKTNTAAGTSPDKYYIFGVIYLTLLTGVLIPSSVVASSPTDFIDAGNYQNPLRYVFSTFTIAAGVFLVWFSVFYMLADNTYKRWISCAVLILSGVFTVDHMFFGNVHGNMSRELVFDNEPFYTYRSVFMNLGLICVLAAVLFLLFTKVHKAVPVVYLALLIGVGVLSGSNLIRTQGELNSLKEYYQNNEADAVSIPLSKEGKNVIVFMLDRSIGRYLPYLINEKPELKEQLAGFTYYPNTVSVGAFTNTGAAALFGGYEYTPDKLNERPEESLKDKQDEALSVLPVLFSENGYEVTVCDPPYAGYKNVPDLSIYDEYPDIKAYHTKGQFTSFLNAGRDSMVQHNFFCYSMFRVTPLGLRKIIYDRGNYNNTRTAETDYTEKFEASYNVLVNLKDITKISEDDANTFLMINNETPHEPCALQTPDYIPVAHVDNADYEKEHSDRFTVDGVTMKMDSASHYNHYYVDMATFLQIGEWLDYLREQGVYDNTRIILVSDHGRGLHQFDDMEAEDGFDYAWFNPVFLVKDFGDEEYAESDAFMSNADTPTLALEGLIEDPKNPFTGKAINSKDKEDGVIAFFSERWDIAVNNGNVFMEDESNLWYRVSDNIFDTDCWTRLEDPSGE